MAVGLLKSLPADFREGHFIGRALSPEGPCVITIEQGVVHDLTQVASTVAGAIARRAFTGGTVIGPVEDGLPEGWSLLAPTDLQCIKASGVTFALSAIERVIEERARGDASAAAAIRAQLEDKVGSGIRSVDRDTPGAGFTHKVGDVVTISSEKLGTLRNTVTTSRDAPAWTMGFAAFAKNLAARGLIEAI